MSSRRSGQSSGSSRISDDQIMDLVTKLQELLPDDILHESTNAKVSASEERQKKDLSERLSQLLATIDSDTPQASIIRSLLATIDSDTTQASTARSSTIDSDTPQASKVLDETCECARKLQGDRGGRPKRATLSAVGYPQI